MYLPSKLYAALISRTSRPLHERLIRVKRALFAGLHGTVVEIGPGNGANIPLLPRRVGSYIGIEPNTGLQRKTLAQDAPIYLDVRVLDGVAEDIPLPAAAADAVISTFVLCTVESQERSLAEIRRILKPRGTLIFIEHVAAAPGTLARRLQALLNPVSRCIACGCELDRETFQAIEAAGFVPDLAAGSPHGGWRPLGPIVAGRAIRGPDKGIPKRPS